MTEILVEECLAINGDDFVFDIHHLVILNSRKIIILKNKEVSCRNDILKNDGKSFSEKKNDIWSKIHVGETF